MDIGSRIDQILRERNIRRKELYEYLEMTKGGFYQALKRNTIKFSTVEKIAEFLNVPMCELCGLRNNDIFTKQPISKSIVGIQELLQKNNDSTQTIIDLLRIRKRELDEIIRGLESYQKNKQALNIDATENMGR